MRVIPIKKRKVVFSTYEGDGGFCCNPKYIAEELHRREENCELVWLVQDTSREFPEYIRVVKNTWWNTVYHLSTAQVWIDNYRKPLGTLKRKGQLYIQTWHASIGFKAVGLYRGNSFPEIAKIVSEWDSKLVDYVLSNSDYCDAVYPKKLLYYGPTLRTGSPRVDCLINRRNELSLDIRKQFNLAMDTKLVLYAPTFRGGTQSKKKNVFIEAPNLDFNLLINTLNEKFGGEWKVLLRLHPQLSAKIKEMPFLGEKDGRIIDVSQFPDNNEIMAACDGVITDYSSCAFDACFAYIPVLLYAEDIDEYKKNRGQFMWRREELPFLIAENNNELMDNIRRFNYNKYLASIREFMKKHGISETGTASKKVVDFLLKYFDDND